MQSRVCKLLSLVWNHYGNLDYNYDGLLLLQSPNYHIRWMSLQWLVFLYIGAGHQ